MTKTEFDQIRDVLTALKVHCQKTASAKKAIKIIAERTAICPKRVKQILIQAFKN